MPRRFVNRLLRRQSNLGEHWAMRPFRALLHDPALWATHRKSIARAFAIGAFVAFIPIPGHVVLAVLLAIWARVNIPMAVLMTFIMNPLTIGPLFGTAYLLGAYLLDVPVNLPDVALSWQWATKQLKPLLVGSLILGTATASIGYVLINVLWRWALSVRLKQRRERRAQRG